MAVTVTVKATGNVGVSIKHDVGGASTIYEISPNTELPLELTPGVVNIFSVEEKELGQSPPADAA